MTKKILALALCFSILFSVASVGRVGAESTNAVTQLHVATDGSDETGNGTIDAPFASVEKARDTIESFSQLPDGGVTVYIHGGEYKLTKTIALDSSNSGEEGAPITYKNYNGEDVSFVGSTVLDGKAIKKVTDTDVLNRLIVKEAKDNIYMLDLNTQGITIPTLKETVFTRFFVNGVSLYNSRWPNNDSSGAQYFTGGQPAPKTEYDTSKYNAAGQPVAMTYVDDEDRSKNWTIKKNEAMLSGGYAYLWAQGQLLIDTIDPEKRIVKSSGNAGYGQDTYTAANDRYLYFEHIFEEIDLPAESFIDREKGILYFYGVGDMSNPTIEFTTFSGTMLKLTDVEYVTFDGIDFKNGKTTAVEMTDGCKNITIKNAVISGMGYYGLIIKGSHIRVEGCNIYDIREKAVQLYGGDRATLASSGNVFTNNKVHHSASSGVGADALYVEGVGHEISHNDIYDYYRNAASFVNTNNLIIEYNRFTNLCKVTADAGALYWGRRVTELGNVVRYNYFYDIGSGLSDSGVSAIFCDDGEVCPEMYGNIFCRAGMDVGGGAKNVSVRLNGAMYLNFHDNLIVDMYGVLNAMSWAVSDTYTNVENLTIPARWWMYSVGLSVNDSSYSSNFTEEQQALIFSNTWKNAYKDTWWGSVYDYINEGLYNAGKTVNDTGVAADMTAWLENNLPEGITNLAKNNALIGGTEVLPEVLNNNGINRNINAVSENNLMLGLTDSIFEDLEGKNFSLTESGLAKIQAFIPDFEAPDFDNMGILTQNGNAPVASNAKVTGVPTKGQSLVASYEYADADGDAEGISRIYWYMSDEEEGEYTRLTDGYGKNLALNDKHDKKYIRYEVVPYDTTYEYGDAVVSEPVFITEVTELSGSGTDAEPYQIGTAAELLFAANQSNSTDETTRLKYAGNTGGSRVYYRITADIDMAGCQFPGFCKESVDMLDETADDDLFYGFISGGGHVISNLTIEGEEGYASGFICKSKRSRITDLGLKNVTIYSGKDAGAFIGEERSDHTSLSTHIQSCFVDGVTFGSAVKGSTGGFIGNYTQSVGYAQLLNCYSRNVPAKSSAYGPFGFIGYNTTTGAPVNMYNCWTTADQELSKAREAIGVYKLVTDSSYTPAIVNSGSQTVWGGSVSGTLTPAALNATPKYTDTAAWTPSVIGFVADRYEQNNGLPVLAWQNDVTYCGIDLTLTEKTVLSAGDETKLVVCGVLENGDVDSQYPIESGVAYNVLADGRDGDVNCVTVDTDGTVKAVCAGVSRVQVTYGSYKKTIVFIVGEIYEDYTATFYDGNNGGWSAVANTGEIVADAGRLGTDGAVLYGTGTTAATIVPSTVNTDANVISFWFYDASPTGVTGQFNLDGGAAMPRNLFTMGMGTSTANKITPHGELPSGNNLSNSGVERTEGWHQFVMYSRYREVASTNKLVLNTRVWIDGVEFVWSTWSVADKKNDSGVFNGRLGGLFGALKWTPKGASAADGSKLIIDDLYIVDANANPHVTVTFDGLTTNATSGTKGSVVYVSQNDSTLSDVIPISNGEAKIPADLDGFVHLKAVPNDGYEVDSFKINGVAYALDSDNKISFIAVDGANVDVQFREVVTTPSISGNADTYIFPGTYTHEGKIYNSFVAFYKMLIPYGKTVSSYGMRVNGLDAKADGKAADDVFGIRVFGEAVEESKTYELEGYVTIEGKEYTTDVIEHVYVK